MAFALLTFYIPFNDFGCTQNQMICALLMIIAACSSLTVNIMQLVYFLPYIAATDFTIFGVPLHVITFLELVVFFKVFSKHGLEGQHVKYVLFLFFYSLPAFVLCSAEFVGVIKYMFNILLFFAILYHLRYIEHKESIGLIYLALATGVLTSCIAGRYYVRPVTEEVFDITESWMRYRGLWTDPNFLGCFCLLGILSLLRLKTNTKIGRLLMWAGCAVIFYYGTLTMSRTYLVVAALLLAAFVLRSTSGSFKTYLIAAVVLAVSIPALMYYVDYLNENRVAGTDSVTNGRYDNTIALLEAQSNDICSIFGAGPDNYSYLYDILKNQSHRAASHNSYVDFLLQFGYVGVLLLLGVIVRYLRKTREMIRSLFQNYGLPMACVLFYMGTLSALKYEFVFIIAALFYYEFKTNQACLKS